MKIYLILKRIMLEPLLWLKALIIYMPGGCEYIARLKLYKIFGLSVGKAARLGPGVRLPNCKKVNLGSNINISRNSRIYAHSGGKIDIGNHFALNENSEINASEGGGIIIGNNVIVAQNVVIRTSDHVFTDLSMLIKN